MSERVNRKAAEPGASSLQFALERVLQVHDVDPAKVSMLMLSPPDIVAAWRRGDIEAAYVAGAGWKLVDG